MATTGIVEERSREVLPPRRQHRLQSAAVEMRAQPLFKEMDDAEPSDGCADRQVHRRAEPHQQRPDRVDPHHFAVALELPGWRRAAGELPAQAGVGEQVARVLRPAARIEIAGCRGRGEALDARADARWRRRRARSDRDGPPEMKGRSERPGPWLPVRSLPRSARRRCSAPLAVRKSNLMVRHASHAEGGVEVGDDHAIVDGASQPRRVAACVLERIPMGALIAGSVQLQLRIFSCASTPYERHWSGALPAKIVIRPKRNVL